MGRSCGKGVGDTNSIGIESHTLPTTQNSLGITFVTSGTTGSQASRSFIQFNTVNVGGPGNIGSLIDPSATNLLEEYIDAAVKPDYIQNFLNENFTALGEKIDASHNTIIQTITNFTQEKASIYLANFALSTIGVVHKAYILSQTHADLLEQYNELNIKCSGFIEKNISVAPIMGSITVDTAFDMRYLLYMQKYGVPEMGIFDPVKLSEFL
tara:strand:+ start:375 stop:1007 length:633 start_codon:yes stop_codon:yes gene_type:complete